VRTESVRRPRKKPAAESRWAARAGSAPGSRSERDALEFRALQSFRTLVGSARQYDAEIRRTTGISGSQLWALAEISGAAGMSVTTLAEHLALHQTTTSNLVNALTERRLIRRTRDAADQRVVRLFATPEGMRLLLRAPQPYTGLLVDAPRKLDAAELASLTRGIATQLPRGGPT